MKEVKVICNSVSITVDQLKKKLPEMREEELKRLDSIARKPGSYERVWCVSKCQY